MSDPLDVYKRQGFGRSVGLGARPALVVVDFINGFADPAVFGGGNIAPAIARTAALLDAARDANLPIAFTRVVYAEDGSDAGVFAAKVPGLLRFTDAAWESAVVGALAPRPGEAVIRKTQPSAFFGTGLSAWLTGRGIDSLIVTGCTTSGCVRATVIDAMSHNYRTVVPPDCVGDRSIPQHDANLIDIEQKYADCVASDALLPRLRAGAWAA